jgi:hypothetical protein
MSQRNVELLLGKILTDDGFRESFLPVGPRSFEIASSLGLRKKGDRPRFSPGSIRGKTGSENRGPSPKGGRRQSTQPLVTVAKARHQEEALAGLDRWKARHPEAAALLQADDVLIDSMRGRSSTWTRIRVNLRHVPEAERPAEEPPDPDYDPWRGVKSDPRWSRAPKTRSSS